ncbi:TetR/AcrR family transcriptional regulator [Pseudonocardia nematodicida]|uniref:TetR/AcrR family transcriptional regulator n=1 Tax=Pseudonocardia nematodicida TaxID=1206997 RepID=A0ABV1KJL3_9PSEU
MNERGPYAKGIAKREEILEQALEVIGREGFAGASIKEVAEAVNLSQAGLLHYFDSKEDLFTAVLRKRDQIDGGVGVTGAADLPELRERFQALARHNTGVPGLVELFSRMAVEAADQGHPANTFFRDRGPDMRAGFAAALRGSQDRGTAPRGIDPDSFSRLLEAVSDGLQLQWLQDPTVDMVGLLGEFFDLVTAPEAADG